jgi:hypothetical protein
MANDDGIQIWTVPTTGTYTIRAAGAKGASENDVAGSGMIVEITTTLTMGEKIKILVGQAGLTPYSSGSGGGGGGGSFVVKYTNNTAILVAGGGGGSDALDLVGPQKNGLVGNNGGNGGPTSGGGTISVPGTGGINGNGGTASSGGSSFGGAGGGGLKTDGGNSFLVYQTWATGGKAFVNGGAGGTFGGFGGGGGLRSNDFGVGGPGGGGYSGGGGGASYSGGGGGGSYSITGSFTASGTLNHDDGYVTITKVLTVVTTTVYDWKSLAVGQSRTFTTNDTLSLSIGDITTIDYSPTDWIKGTVSSVTGTNITLNITDLASKSYTISKLMDTTIPQYAQTSFTSGYSLSLVDNVTPATIPANSIITEVYTYVGSYDDNSPRPPLTGQITINGQNIVRGTSSTTNINRYTSSQVQNLQNILISFKFDGGCFVSSQQKPTSVNVNTTTSANMWYVSANFDRFNFYGYFNGYSLSYNTGIMLIKKTEP